MSKTALKWALWLAERGLLIAPLPAGSKSAKGLKEWKETYTTDADRIRTWFDLAPNMNYLVCAGPDYTIVDVDMKHGIDGNAGFAALEAENFPAATFKVRTPHGGHHLYYKTHVKTGNTHRFPKSCNVDVRGEAGYVVGPGSTVEEKVYTVVDDQEPISAPGWMLPLFVPSKTKDDNAQDPLFDLDTPEAVDRARAYLRVRPGAVWGDNGDHHTFVTFNQIKDLGISKEKAMGLVLEPGGWNSKCEPPWDTAELGIKADNAYVYGKNRPGSKGGGIIDKYEETCGPEDMVDISHLDLPEEDSDPFSEFRPFLLRGDGLWEADTYQRFIIPEWLPDNGYACLLASRGVGKTTLMIDLASCIAMDMEWHGWPILEGYHSIYFCGEHDTVALQMLRAWKIHNLGMDVASGNRFIFLRNSSDLLDTEKTEKWMQFLRQEIGPQGKAVVFLDTWQRATAGSSQNDDGEMQKAAKNAEMLSSYLGGPMVVASHPNKSNPDAVSGAYQIENSSAAIWHLSNDGVGSKILEVTRLKGLGEGNRLELDFDIINFDEEDEHGRTITGQAVTRTGGSPPTADFKEQEKAKAAEPTSKEAKAAEELEADREELAKFLIFFKTHIQPADEKGSKQINKSVFCKEMVRLYKTSATARKESKHDTRLYEAATGYVLDASTSMKTCDRMVFKCFIDPKYIATVKDEDGVEWDVQFLKEGSPWNLHVTRAVKIS